MNKESNDSEGSDLKVNNFYSLIFKFKFWKETNPMVVIRELDRHWFSYLGHSEFFIPPESITYFLVASSHSPNLQDQVEVHRGCITSFAGIFLSDSMENVIFM